MDSTRHTCLRLEITERSENENSEVIFIKATWFDSHFDLSITSGDDAWICNASEAEVRERANQWDQPVSEYIETAEKYLGFRQPGSIYSFVDAGNGYKRLSWTFEKQGTKLEWRWKCKPSPNNKNTTTEILDFLMDANIRLSMPRQKITEPKETESKIDSARWTPYLHKIWVDICVELVKKGKRPGTSLNVSGYSFLIKQFQTTTGLSYTKKQHKNHWDKTKGIWARWIKLKACSGVGYDAVNNKVLASDEWWNSWLEKNKTDAQWRYDGLEHVEELNILFGGTNVTGEYVASSFNPGACPSIESSRAVEYELQDDNNDDDAFVQETQPLKSQPLGSQLPIDISPDVDGDGIPTFIASPCRRSRGDLDFQHHSKRQKMTNVVMLGRQIERLVEAVSSRTNASVSASSTTPSPPPTQLGSIRECIDLLDATIEIIPNSDRYRFALKLFSMKKEYRQIWCILRTNELRVGWLDGEMEDARVHRSK